MTANGETCWCGCGEPVKEGSAFLPGHDRRAEAAVIKLKYGSIQKFVEAHGYGHGGKNLAQELAESGRRDTIEKGAEMTTTRPLSALAVYAIKHTTDLDDAYRQGGHGSFVEGRHWKTARQNFLKAREQGRAMPIIFASAETTDRLLYHAILDDVALSMEDDRERTTYRFSGLMPIEGHLPLSSLTVDGTGKQLSNNHRRSYVNCRTPSFLAES